jgi:hypothetical protein
MYFVANIIREKIKAHRNMLEQRNIKQNDNKTSKSKNQSTALAGSSSGTSSLYHDAAESQIAAMR